MGELYEIADDGSVIPAYLKTKLNRLLKSDLITNSDKTYIRSRLRRVRKSNAPEARTPPTEQRRPRLQPTVDARLPDVSDVFDAPAASGGGGGASVNPRQLDLDIEALGADIGVDVRVNDANLRNRINQNIRKLEQGGLTEAELNAIHNELRPIYDSTTIPFRIKNRIQKAVEDYNRRAAAAASGGGSSSGVHRMSGKGSRKAPINDEGDPTVITTPRIETAMSFLVNPRISASDEEAQINYLRKALNADNVSERNKAKIVKFMNENGIVAVTTPSINGAINFLANPRISASDEEQQLGFLEQALTDEELKPTNRRKITKFLQNYKPKHSGSATAAAGGGGSTDYNSMAGITMTNLANPRMSPTKRAEQIAYLESLRPHVSSPVKKQIDTTLKKQKGRAAARGGGGAGDAISAVFQRIDQEVAEYSDL